jgi:hypothetical protein
MRFSETPVSDPNAVLPQREAGPTPSLPPATDGTATSEDRKRGESEKGTGSPEARAGAAKLIESIGCEFSRLRKEGRNAAWADLEDKVAKAGHVLVPSGMISAKDWVGMMIDIEQFRKSEGGNMESPGDALARWLSEGSEVVTEKPKRSKKAKVQ